MENVAPPTASSQEAAPALMSTPSKSPVVPVIISSVVTAVVVSGIMVTWLRPGSINTTVKKLSSPLTNSASTAPGVIKTVSFTYPYQFSWSETGTNFDITQMQYGTGITPSSYFKYPDAVKSEPKDDKYRLSFKLKLTVLGQNVAPRVSLRYLSDSTATIIIPESSDFIFSSSGSYAQANSTYDEYVSFVVPKEDPAFIIKFPTYYLVASNLTATAPTITKVASISDLPITSQELKGELSHIQ
jgi:hypothetical protein